MKTVSRNFWKICCLCQKLHGGSWFWFLEMSKIPRKSNFKAAKMLKMAVLESQNAFHVKSEWQTISIISCGIQYLRETTPFLAKSRPLRLEFTGRTGRLLFAIHLNMNLLNKTTLFNFDSVDDESSGGSFSLLSGIDWNSYDANAVLTHFEALNFMNFALFEGWNLAN